MQRLRRPQDFASCYRRGRVVKDRHIVVHARVNNTGITRLGFSVSKKIGNAVTRNGVKRRLREITRRLEDRLNCGYDVVITARAAAPAATFQDLSRSVEKMLERIGVVKKEEGGCR